MIIQAKKTLLFILLSTSVALFAHQTKLDNGAPYNIHDCLTRAEELFESSNYQKAIIFYYEGLLMAENRELISRLHFRIGECLEALRRFDFAVWHYQQALKGTLPNLLRSRAIMKLEHLPELAQTEEAKRLFDRAMELYQNRDLRRASEKYLSSLRLKPSLMAKDEQGLIDDAVHYLTYLTESKDREPDRLMKLATLLELRGDVEKAVETLQQLLIIYPDSDAAVYAESKLSGFSTTSSVYLEPETPRRISFADQYYEIFSDSFEFKGPGTISRQVQQAAFTIRAVNERNGIPSDRFEMFLITLGFGGDERSFYFNSEEGIDTKELSFETESYAYTVIFNAIDQTRGYVQNLYGGGKRPVTLFSYLKVTLKIQKLAG